MNTSQIPDDFSNTVRKGQLLDQYQKIGLYLPNILSNIKSYIYNLKGQHEKKVRQLDKQKYKYFCKNIVFFDE